MDRIDNSNTTAPSQPSVPPYTPQVSTDNVELRNDITKILNDFNDKMDATLAMITISLKEYRDSIGDEILYSEERIVRTKREDRFFKATDEMASNIKKLTDALNKIVKLFDDKNKEQDAALGSMSGGINTSLEKVNSAVEKVNSEVEKVNSEVEKVNSAVEEAEKKTGSLMPIGTIVAFPFRMSNSIWDTLDDNWIRCDGSKISSDSKYEKLRNVLTNSIYDKKLSIPSIGSYNSTISDILSYNNITNGERNSIISMTWDDYIRFMNYYGRQFDSINTLEKRLDILKADGFYKEFKVNTNYELRLNGDGRHILVIDGSDVSSKIQYRNQWFIEIEGENFVYRLWMGAKSSGNFDNSLAQGENSNFSKSFPSVITCRSSELNKLVKMENRKAIIKIWYTSSSTNLGGNSGGIYLPNLVSDDLNLISGNSNIGIKDIDIINKPTNNVTDFTSLKAHLMDYYMKYS